MSDLYCADIETPVTADFIEYGRSLCSPCFFRHKEIDEYVSRVIGGELKANELP